MEHLLTALMMKPGSPPPSLPTVAANENMLVPTEAELAEGIKGGGISSSLDFKFVTSKIVAGDEKVKEILYKRLLKPPYLLSIYREDAYHIIPQFGNFVGIVKTGEDYTTAARYEIVKPIVDTGASDTFLYIRDVDHMLKFFDDCHNRGMDVNVQTGQGVGVNYVVYMQISDNALTKGYSLFLHLSNSIGNFASPSPIVGVSLNKEDCDALLTKQPVYLTEKDKVNLQKCVEVSNCLESIIGPANSEDTTLIGPKALMLNTCAFRGDRASLICSSDPANLTLSAAASIIVRNTSMRL